MSTEDQHPAVSPPPPCCHTQHIRRHHEHSCLRVRALGSGDSKVGFLGAFSLSHGVMDPEEGNSMKPSLYRLRDSWI